MQRIRVPLPNLLFLTLFLTIFLLPVISISGEKGSDTFIRAKEDPVIHYTLQERTQNNELNEEVTVWVFFTDKGIFTAEAYRTSCQKVEQSLSDRVRWRRGKVRDERLIDFRDLPVEDSYIEAVLATGAIHRTTTRWFNGISVNAPVESLTRIASLPWVREIRPVRGYTREPLPSPRPALKRPPFQRKSFQLNYGPSYDQLQQINVPAVHEMGYSGAGVLICMLDSGFNREHESLQNIDFVAEWDFINDDGNTKNELGDPQYQDYHGTRTLSVTGGSSPGNLYGPAYGASFILGKTEDTSQEVPVEEDFWVEAVEWAEAQGADVISSSLSYTDWYTYGDMDGNTAVTTRAADIAATKGIVVCNSAGNARDDPWYYIGAPADADSILAVGAVDVSGEISWFSSAGPTSDGRTKPEVCARGVDTCLANPGDPSGYQDRNGTSFSCPLVAGCAALVLEAHPDWTPMQVREALMMTADQAHHPDNLYGWGIVDVLAAIAYPCDIDVTIPNGGETWSAGAIETITWSSGNTGDYVTIDYSTNGGADWSTVIPLTANDGSYPWSIPNTPSVDCLVKICDAENSGCCDQSNGAFEISGYGSHLIAHYPLSSNGIDATGNQAPMTLIDTPFQEGGIYCNGLYWYTNAETPNIEGFNETAFTISARFKVTDYPSEDMPVFMLGHGCRWLGYYLESEETVTLSGNNGLIVQNSVVRYATNIWHEATVTYDANTGTGRLYLDDILACTANFQIDFSVCPDRSISINDYSVGRAFEGFLSDLRVYDIVTINIPPCDMTLTSPVGGETWCIDEEHDITWLTEYGSGTVKIDFSIDGGSSWWPVIAGTPDDGSFSWTIPTFIAPDLPSTACLVRICDLQQTDCCAETITPFEISGCACRIAIVSPSGGESWCAEETHDISWTSNFTSGAVHIEYSTNGGADWLTVIADTPDDGSYSWTIPNRPSTDCFVRLCDVEDAGCCDETDSPSVISGCGPLEIVTESLPDGYADIQYNVPLVATGGVLPYSWSITSGALPVGLNLDTNSGAISGASEVLGTFCFTVEVTDDLGVTDTQDLCLTLSEYGGLRGDPNNDGVIDILDVLDVVNHILGTTPLTGDGLTWGDCNGDDVVNILDALGIVNVVLGTGECTPAACRTQLTPEVMNVLKSLQVYLSAEEYSRIISLVKGERPIPAEYSLVQNYPNPFNPVTTIAYALPEAARVKVEVFNLLGQKIAVLVEADQRAGTHSVRWDASDMANGVYFYRLSVNDGFWTKTIRMVLMK
ncbi:MAG: S8 family serine peptidase [Gemmatimonadota bacterium]|nr:MAG: S8 family serine peptidase [Gemmatimonadota bacterium]